MYITFRATPGIAGVALRLLFLLVYPVLIARAASTPRMDSLRTALGRAGHDTSRVSILNQLSYCAVQAAQLEQAVRFARQALAIARQAGYQPGIGNAWSNLGLTYVYQSQYAASIKAYDHALAAFRKSGSPVDQANVLYTTSFNYINQGDYAMALQCNLAALRLLEKRRSPGGQKTYADVLVALAKVYKHQRDFGKALHFTGRALEAYVSTRDSVGMVAANVEMGLIHRELTNLHLSVQYSREALAMIARLAGSGERYAADAAYLQYLKQDARQDLARVSVLRGEFSAAIPLLEEALHYYREAGSPGAVAQCYVSVAEAYRGLGAYGRAHQCLAEGIRMAQAVAERQVLLEGYRVLADVYQDQGQYGRALRVTQRRSSLKDSLHEAQSRRQLVALESQYENHRKEQQLAESRRQVGEMQRERQITRLQMQLLLVVMVCLAVTGWLLLRQYRLRHQRNLAREAARQAALEEQQARDEAQLERLHGELALRNREFTSQSLHLLQKNQGLNSKLEEIADLTRNADSDALERVHRLVKSAEDPARIGKSSGRFSKGYTRLFFRSCRHSTPPLRRPTCGSAPCSNSILLPKTWPPT